MAKLRNTLVRPWSPNNGHYRPYARRHTSCSDPPYCFDEFKLKPLSACHQSPFCMFYQLFTQYIYCAHAIPISIQCAMRVKLPVNGCRHIRLECKFCGFSAAESDIGICVFRVVGNVYQLSGYSQCQWFVFDLPLSWWMTVASNYFRSHSSFSSLQIHSIRLWTDRIYIRH